MILLIDNHDSFTYNLYQYLRELKTTVVVCRNDLPDSRTSTGHETVSIGFFTGTEASR